MYSAMHIRSKEQPAEQQEGDDRHGRDHGWVGIGPLLFDQQLELCQLGWQRGGRGGDTALRCTHPPPLYGAGLGLDKADAVRHSWAGRRVLLRWWRQ